MIVRKDDRSIYSGIFDRADSIQLTLPVEGNVMVEASAYKRGSGPGLYYYYRWGGNQRDYSTSAIYGNASNTGVVTNKMDTISYRDGGSHRADSLGRLAVFNPADTTRPVFMLHSELDTYYGQVIFAGASAPSVIDLPMKRRVFGVQYSADNFSSGRIIADFSGLMTTKYITTGDTATQYLYTAKEFLVRDSLLNDAVMVKMKWEKPDGNIVSLGEKKIYFKRNILTKIHVSVPASGSAPLTPVISETDWSGTENVSF